MRKITMKRKSKTNDNNKNAAEAAAEDVDDVIQEDSTNSNSEAENGTGGRRSKSKKLDSSEDEQSNVSEKSEKRSHKKKNKRGRKSKISVEESNGNAEDATENKDVEEEVFEVEEILDQKNVKGVKHYLIRWKGYGEDSDTWEPVTTLDCPEIIAKFLKSQKKGKKRPSSSNANSKSPKKGKNTEDGEEEVGEYEVDRILEVHFKRNGGREFLVHWKGYPSNENTWEPEENMSCHDLIEKFMEKVNKARASDTRELRVNRKPTNHFTLSMQQTGRRLSRRNLGKQRAQYHELE